MTKSILFIKGDYSFDSHNDFPDDHYEFQRLVLDSQLGIYDDDTLFCILYGGVDRFLWHYIVTEQIKKTNSKKVVFIVEDVFRLWKYRPTIVITDSMISQYACPELELIKKVIEDNDIEYDIYACEKNPVEFEKKYGLEIKYFDMFLTSYNTSWVLARPDISDGAITQSNEFNLKATCFNNRYEPHRQMIANLLYKNEDVLVSYVDHIKEKNTHLVGFDIEKFDDDIKSAFYDIEFETYQKILVRDKELKQDDTMNFSKLGFLNIVTETRMGTKMPYISEKTLKPIFVRRPFILLAPFGSLQLMKEYGFKTFDKWWDESYDNIEDHTLRFQAAYRSIQKVLSKSLDELDEIYLEMLPILEHNQENLRSMKWQKSKT